METCWVVVSVLSALAVVYWSLCRHLANVVARLQEKRDRLFEETAKKIETVDAQIRRDIQALDLTQLLAALRNGQYSTVQVLRAFQERAIEANTRTNSVIMMIEEADDWAKQLDRSAESTDYKKPELFGLPISIKESIAVKGYPRTRGYASEAEEVMDEDALLISHLKQLGKYNRAIIELLKPFRRYSLRADECAPEPVDILLLESDLWSNSSSPRSLSNTRRLFGWRGGVDCRWWLFGRDRWRCGRVDSNTLPFLWHRWDQGLLSNNVHFVQPSHLRISARGCTASVPGRPLINASCGPMASSVEGCIRILQAIWREPTDVDPYVPPVPWNEALFACQKPLTIGYYETDGWFLPHPAIRRAVRESVKILESKGHRLVPFHPPVIPKAFQLFCGAVTVDGARYLLNKLDADIPLPEYRPLLLLYRIPWPIKRLLGFLLRPIYPRISKVLMALPISTSELRAIYEDIGKYRELFTRQMNGLDALICPPQVLPAMPHAAPMKLIATVSYPGVFNLLDFSAGVVPVTTVTEEDELKMARDYPSSDPWYRDAKRAAQGSIGLPIGVQCATPPYKEEVCLRILNEIEMSVNGNKKQ